MRLTRQVELLERLVGVDTTRPWSRAEASMRNPASVYTDPARFAIEEAVLFRNRPQFVGLTDDCRKPGDYLTTRLGGVPILVIRLGNLTHTLSNLSPAIYATPGFEGARTSTNGDFVGAVTHANVDLNVKSITERSRVIADLVDQGKVQIVGAVYDLATGSVTFRNEGLR
jgi:hypothetical protein